MAVVLRTKRLSLRRVIDDDAPFILQLLNDPGWLRNIGDRGVYDLAGARAYVRDNLQAMYREHGFGLYLVTAADSDEAMGLCGILKRPTLTDADLGYAFLPPFRGQGYALEAARGAVEYANASLGLSRLVAITLNANAASVRLLSALGFSYECQVEDAGDEPLARYAWQAP